MKISRWIRVNKHHKCPRCEHDSWCCYTEEGLVLCMRVESNTPSKGKVGGWIHKPDDKFKPYVPPVRNETKTINAFAIWSAWRKDNDDSKMIDMAARLGVNPISLHDLGCVWASQHNAWAFPMKNEDSNIVGIRLRNDKGDKWAVTGSKQGLFLSKSVPQKRVYITEGPTDTAAALTIGFSVIGRPACLGCEEMILEVIKRNRIHEVVIVADNDAPGMRGAEKLQNMLKVPSCVWIPPCKDMREFVNLGGNKETVESIIKNLIWRKPRCEKQ